MVRHLRKSRGGRRSFTSFLSRAPASNEEHVSATPNWLERDMRHLTSPLAGSISRYRRNTITRYGNRIAILSELTEPRTPDARGGVTGHATPMATRELMERFDMSRPMDQIDNSRTKPLQAEHHGQLSSGRSQSDVRLENCESQARRVLPDSLITNQRGPVTLLRVSRPAKRNALDDATISGIESFFSDPPEETRVVILHGEGKHFSAGADLSAFADISPSGRVHFRGPGTVPSTVSRMAACRSSLYCRAPSSVAVWSLRLLRISGWLNVARTTPCRRPRAAYSLAAAVPCAYRA